MADDDEATNQTVTDESETNDETERPDSHLDDVDDGCGCAEVWEHLSERRDDE
jgi:hypothetical protein